MRRRAASRTCSCRDLRRRADGQGAAAGTLVRSRRERPLRRRARRLRRRHVLGDLRPRPHRRQHRVRRAHAGGPGPAHRRRVPHEVGLGPRRGARHLLGGPGQERGELYGVIFWVPALVLTLLVFGLPSYLAQRAADRGLGSEDRGERVVALVATALGAVAIAASLATALSAGERGSARSGLQAEGAPPSTRYGAGRTAPCGSSPRAQFPSSELAMSGVAGPPPQARLATRRMRCPHARGGRRPNLTAHRSRGTTRAGAPLSDETVCASWYSLMLMVIRFCSPPAAVRRAAEARRLPGATHAWPRPGPEVSGPGEGERNLARLQGQALGPGLAAAAPCRRHLSSTSAEGRRRRRSTRWCRTTSRRSTARSTMARLRSAVREEGARGLPGLRPSLPGLRASPLRRVRGDTARGVQLQGPGLLSVMPGSEDGGDRGASHRGRLAGGALSVNVPS